MHNPVRSATAATPLLGERDAEQAELSHLQHGVDRERVVSVPRFGVRLDLVVGELTHEAPERLVLVGQLGMHDGEASAPTLDQAPTYCLRCWAVSVVPCATNSAGVPSNTTLPPS